MGSEMCIRDRKDHNQKETLQSLKGVATLVMHAPDDQTVPLENAGYIYSALNHPKSFAALAGADHLLTKQRDAQYAADLITLWYSHNCEG